MEEVGRPEVKKQILTPLLWYRNRVRLIWARDDPDALNLMVLLGFEKEAMEKAKTAQSGHQIEGWMSPFAIPGKPFNPEERHTIGGLPKGAKVEKPDAIEGLPRGEPTIQMTGRIEWTFGFVLQQAVYELTQQCRWRAKMCPVCGKYFVAKKTAQKHCSTTCYREKKIREALDFYHRPRGGKDRREERRELEKSKKRKI